MSVVLKEPKKTSTSSFKAINCEKPRCKHANIIPIKVWHKTFVSHV